MGDDNNGGGDFGSLDDDVDAAISVNENDDENEAEVDKRSCDGAGVSDNDINYANNNENLHRYT